MDIFDVKIDGLQEDKDFTVDRQGINLNSTTRPLRYKIDFKEQYENDDLEINFVLKSELGFFSKQRNQLPK